MKYTPHQLEMKATYEELRRLKRDALLKEVGWEAKRMRTLTKGFLINILMCRQYGERATNRFHQKKWKLMPLREKERLHSRLWSNTIENEV